MRQAEIKKENGKYILPLEVRSEFSIKMHLLFIVLIAGLCTLGIIFRNDWDFEAIITKIFCLSGAVFLLYIWIFAGILHLCKIEIDNISISVRAPYNRRTLNWSDVYNADIVRDRSIENLEITAVPEEKQNEFKRIFQIMFNTDKNVIYTPLSIFGGIDSYALMNTINEILEKYSSH